MTQEFVGLATFIRNQLDLKMVTGRYSFSLAVELMRCVEQGTANIAPIIEEIGGLEGDPSNSTTRTKPAAPFTRPLLAGLWHKHYIQGAFVAKNIENHWKDNDLDELVRTIILDDTIPSGEKILAMSRAVAEDAYQKRGEDQRITGEWIVYARHMCANYYLTLGKHGEEDRAIRDRALACRREFPHLDICR